MWFESMQVVVPSRNIHLSDSSLGLLYIRMAQALRRNIDHHRMETAVEPERKGLQTPFAKPDGRDTMPSIQLLLEDFIADLRQIFQRLLIGFPLPQQVYGRFQPQVVQCQMRALPSMSPSRSIVCSRNLLTPSSRPKTRSVHMA